MNIKNISGQKSDLSFLLLYSPQRHDPRFGAVKPEGSLGLLYLAGALEDYGFYAKILDCTVGDDRHNLADTFYKHIVLPNKMIRVGLPTSEIIRIASDFDIIGISSIFTAQTTMVVEVVRSIKEVYPEKLIIIGGVNARSQPELFFDAGVDIVTLSESEKTIVEIGNWFRTRSPDLGVISGISFRDEDGKTRTNPTIYVEQDLDKLPVPRWVKLPNERYWAIARPHGGGFSSDHPVKYAPLMTSRGCPFKCHFCHIGLEGKGSDSGNLRELRVKSLERVMLEMNILRGLGVEHFFLEDDSLLGRKKRAMEIFKSIISLNVRLSGVNGVNIAHLCTTKNGQFEVDTELLTLMAQAGFTKFMLPVESGSQRIIDKYATGKLNLERHNIEGLIKTSVSLGMEVGANYTFGYPDETMEEVKQTFELAKRHMAAGLSNANFMIITPFPGTEFFNRVIAENLFLPGVKWDELDWTKVAIKTSVPKEVLEEMIVDGWAKVNKPERVQHIRSMAPGASSIRS